VDVIYRLLAASDTAAVGHPDVTAADIKVDLATPGVDLTQDAWLVLDADGEAVVYGWVHAPGEGDSVRGDLYAQPGDESLFAPWLVRTLEARGVEIVATRGHRQAVVDVGLYRQQDGMAAVVRDAGYDVATTFVRMYVELTGPASDAPVPDAVEIRRLGEGDDDLRTLHEILDDSFADHFGYVPESYDDFRAGLANDEAAGLGGVGQRWLALLDGKPVGAVMGNDSHVEDENAGYVGMLGVRREARGRGIGRLLLLTAFDQSRRSGRSGVFLGVDTNNVTDALRLYESVGMRPVVTIDIWRKQIATQ
jgi:ribosomal protein S18 acetylase RimI-like enzyme